MVNTFFLHTDFATSASMLDKARLGKQRVEAMQILNICYAYRALANYFGISQIDVTNPTMCSKAYRTNWRKQLYSLLIKHGGYAIRRDDRILAFSSVKMKDTNVSKGFMHHPASAMWFGYEDALCAYINAHIDEWVRRGCQNTMYWYDIQTYVKPWWISDEIVQNHRISMAYREIERKEKLWYMDEERFGRMFIDLYDEKKEQPALLWY